MALFILAIEKHCSPLLNKQCDFLPLLPPCVPADSL